MLIFLKTYGCSGNYCDSRRLARALARRGGRVYCQDWGSDRVALRSAGEEELARACDAFVVNTCAISGQSEAFLQSAFAQTVRRLNARAALVYTGCSVRSGRSSLRLGGCGALLLPEQKAVVSALGAGGETAARRGGVRDGAGEGGSGYFYVMCRQGCDRGCSYCACRRVNRGRSRSLAMVDIHAQLDAAAELGCSNVVLSGPCVGAWTEPGGERLDFSNLLGQVLRRRGVRVCALELNPLDVCDRLLELFCCEKVAGQQISIPIQSGSDRVLVRMRRGYDRRYLERLFGRLYRCCPKADITTDIIVGFPGETGRDIAETLGFLVNFPFRRIDVYPYSRRPGTAAARWEALARSTSERHMRMVQRSRGRRSRLNVLFADELGWEDA